MRRILREYAECGKKQGYADGILHGFGFQGWLEAAEKLETQVKLAITGQPQKPLEAAEKLESQVKLAITGQPQKPLEAAEKLETQAARSGGEARNPS